MIWSPGCATGLQRDGGRADAWEPRGEWHPGRTQPERLGPDQHQRRTHLRRPHPGADELLYCYVQCYIFYIAMLNVYCIISHRGYAPEPATEPNPLTR